MMKRMISLLIILIFVLSLTIPAAAAGLNEGKYVDWWRMTDSREIDMTQKRESIIGDVNFDGSVNAVDALWALQYGVEGTAYEWLPRPMGFDHTFELCMIRYYKKKIYDNPWVNHMVPSDARYYYYFYNSTFLADTSNDLQVGADDALEILQYAVGKRENFTRTDFSGSSEFCYCPWPGDWEPRMLYDLDDRNYENLVWPPEGE